MDGLGKSRTRCAVTAFVVAWAVAIFVPSSLVAGFALAPPATASVPDLASLPGAVWAVADAVAPAVKLVIGALLLLGLLASFRGPNGGTARLLSAVVVGAFAVGLPLLLPIGLSAGYGIGLSGERFAPALTAAYLLGGVAAGAFFAISFARCRSSVRP